jgi:metal-responsive CopG/Arc/MetJ family transcriptional regulator
MQEDVKKKSETNVVKSYSLNKSLLQEFSEYCKKNKLRASRVVEELIFSYLQKAKKGANNVEK